MEAYARFVGPIGSRCGIAQENVIDGSDDKDGDEPTELPLHQRQGDGLTPDEAHEFVHHQPEAVEIAKVGEVEEEACAV